MTNSERLHNKIGTHVYLCEFIQGYSTNSILCRQTKASVVKKGTSPEVTKFNCSLNSFSNFFTRTFFLKINY